VDMQKAVRDFNHEREQKSQPLIKIGIGMHTGPLIMGITGDHDRLDATTISDTVNIASRLESLTKYYKGKIIVSEATLQQIDTPLESFHLRHLGKVQLKGKLVPVSIHECFSGDTAEQIQNKIATLEFFNQGMRHYLSRSFSQAHSSFKKLVEDDPHDLTAQFFLDNTARYISDGVPENWVGVEEMLRK
jgi:adenylate cyclase